MLEVFTFRLILEVKGIFRLLLLLYCCNCCNFLPKSMRCHKVLKTSLFSFVYHVPSGNMKSWVTSQRTGPGALTITQQPVHSQ